MFDSLIWYINSNFTKSPKTEIGPYYAHILLPTEDYGPQFFIVLKLPISESEAQAELVKFLLMRARFFEKNERKWSLKALVPNYPREAEGFNIQAALLAESVSKACFLGVHTRDYSWYRFFYFFFGVCLHSFSCALSLFMVWVTNSFFQSKIFTGKYEFPWGISYPPYDFFQMSFNFLW